MAHITKEYYEALKDHDLIVKHDWTNIARLSAQAGFQKGKGYCRQTIATVVKKGINTSDELVMLIRSYFEPKIDAYEAQQAMAKTIKMRMEFA
jgi:hypothetical protein